MVTGQVLSPQMLEQLITAGEFTTNFSAAIRKFGTKFIAVRPVPENCQAIMYSLVDPNERIEPDICYVSKPKNL